MQVKKFEAPTIQEALETIKRELGPEAIILQTKQHKRGFGLMSKSSVEITAAVSDRSIQKKKFVDQKLPEGKRKEVEKFAAEKQASMYDKYGDSHLDRLMGMQGGEKVQVQAAAARAAQAAQSAAAPKKPAQQQQIQQPQRAPAAPAAPSKKLTATRYIDIEDESARGAQKRASGGALSAGTPRVSPMVAGNMPVEEEIKHLKRMIQEMQNQHETRADEAIGSRGPSGTGAFATPALQDVFEQLVINGMDKRHALPMIRQVGAALGPEASQNPEFVLDQVAVAIMEGTQTLNPLGNIQPRDPQAGTGSGPAVIAIIGPTGVGKTTTVAKVASDAILKRNLKVGLINLDSYKVAAFDQLATYAKILNVPFRSAASVEDLAAAIRDFQGLDLVLLDTTGRSQRDPASLTEMAEMIKSIPQAQSQLVLSVTTRDQELYDMSSRFSMFKPQGLIVSKLDEGTIYGAIYNLTQKTQLPLLYFTTGQRVPEDIEESTRERVAALILDL